jgi:hypothetical protein
MIKQFAKTTRGGCQLMPGRNYLWRDHSSNATFVCNEYRDEGLGMRESLINQRRFASAEDVGEYLSSTGVRSFSVTTAGSHPILIEDHCTPEMLIERFLDHGRERWQSFNLINRSL